MKLLSDRSYAALVYERDRAREHNLSLRKRLRQIETNYQALVLRVGLKGFDVEFQPEIPAKPATLVLRRSKES